MATSKRKRKHNYSKYFSNLKGAWYLVRVIHKSDLHGLFDREIETKRLRNKLVYHQDWDNIEPFLSKRWSLPNVYTNPVKRSRIKKHVHSYSMLKAEDIMNPMGEPSTQLELMNKFLAKGGKK